MKTCAWFLACDNLAAGTVAHPIIGAVPTCERCAKMLGLDLRPWPYSFGCPVATIETETT